MRLALLDVAGVLSVDLLPGQQRLRVAYDAARVAPRTLLAALKGVPARVVLVAYPAAAAMTPGRREDAPDAGHRTPLAENPTRHR
jgi:hypothetical protein